MERGRIVLSKQGVHALAATIRDKTAELNRLATEAKGAYGDLSATFRDSRIQIIGAAITETLSGYEQHKADIDKASDALDRYAETLP